LVAGDVDAEHDTCAGRLRLLSRRIRAIRPPMGKDVTAF
jgi:hypothetical protein